VAIVVEPGREHLLAVRFSLAHGHELEHGLRGIVVRLGDLQAMMRSATAPLRALVPFMAAAAGLAAALALVHLLLFVFDPRTREHLYFAAFAGFLALDVLADMMTNLTADFAAQLLWFRLGVTFLVVMLLAGIQLELVLFERRRGWVFWGLVAAGGAMVAWAWWIPGLRDISLLVVFMILALAEMLRLAVLELAARRPDSAVLAVGLGIFALSFSDFFAGYLGFPHFPAGIFVLIGWSAPVVALSLFIARRASRTNRELRRRLDEVDTLTKRTIEQERSAAHERAERQVLEVEHARKTRELEDAQALQLAMLPHDRPSLDAVDVAFLMSTASEIGGDYYDYVDDSSGRCVIAVGDATGHGMHAGMVVAVAKSLFATLAPTHDPVRVLHEISLRLAGLRRRGAAMALALVRIDGKRLEIAGAAMPPLLVWRRADRTVEEIALSALPVGQRSDPEYPRHTLEMAPGDTALVFTDGLAEVLDPADDPFGYRRVADAFARAADREPEGILQTLLDGAQEYAKGRALTDDVTLVAIRAREATPSSAEDAMPSVEKG
jgi:serine phosphatase RsbU (regulator of sigma subunit)